jgi:hypothetical protein
MKKWVYVPARTGDRVIRSSDPQTWIDEGWQMAEQEQEGVLVSIDLARTAEMASYDALAQGLKAQGGIAQDQRTRLQQTLEAAGFDPARHFQELAQGKLDLIWAIALTGLNACLAVFVLLGFGPFWLTLPLGLLVLVTALPVEEFFQAYEEQASLREALFLTLAVLSLSAQFWLGTVRGLFLTALSPTEAGPVTQALAAAGPILRYGLGVLAVASECLCGYKLYRARARLCSATARAVRERDRLDQQLLWLHGTIKAAEIEPAMRHAYRRIGARQYLGSRTDPPPADEHRHFKHAVAGTVILLLMLVLLFFVTSSAFGQTATRTIILLDLSQSTSPEHFAANVQMVTNTIPTLAAGHHIRVVGITDSFGHTRVLFDRRLPANAGYLGLELRAARELVAADWRTVAATLRPIYTRTDVLGALVFLSYLSDPPAQGTRLVVLSDLRQSTTVNLEVMDRIEVNAALKNITHRMTLPTLKDVQVYLLGVDPSGKTATYLASLKAFWLRLFADAGAVVHLFTVDRQLPAL